MARQTTKAEENSWLARCRYPDCEEIKVRCPVCKKPGHVTPHVMGEYKVRICIQHAHFLENVDAGRNMFCETQETAIVLESQIQRTWRLNADARRNIIDYECRRLSK